MDVFPFSEATRSQDAIGDATRGIRCLAHLIAECRDESLYQNNREGLSFLLDGLASLIDAAAHHLDRDDSDATSKVEEAQALAHQAGYRVGWDSAMDAVKTLRPELPIPDLTEPTAKSSAGAARA